MDALAEPTAMIRNPSPLPPDSPTPRFPTPERLAEAGAPPDGTVMSESEALALHVRFLLEWNDGRLEYLPMPTELHQRIAQFLWETLRDAARERGYNPVVILAPFFVRVPNRLREPDVVMMLDRADPRRHNDRWDGADLAVEVVSPDDPNRDLIAKRRDYAAAGIREYWIVDPRPGHRRVAVLSLEDGTYHGDFMDENGVAESRLFADLAIPVADILEPD